MINSYEQNLIVQATDFDIPYRGIDMAFRRTYNSFSGHDFADDDGSAEIGQYGNGWTNTFDAHVSSATSCPEAGSTGLYGFSVFDIDGARYDYCLNTAGQLVPPAGLQGTTLVASSDGSTISWTKKSGTTYTFYAPYYIGESAAYSGRIYQITARNQNNFLQFSYSWIGDASSSANLSQISVSTDASMLVTKLKFATFSGQQLLSEVDRPGGAVYTYGYDSSGNLTTVSKPPPNNSGVAVSETYGGYHGLFEIAGPRWTTAPKADGGYVAFQESGLGSAQTTNVQWVGIVNPGPSYLTDETNTYLQPGLPTGSQEYRSEAITANATNTAFLDTDGHQIVQYFNAETGTSSQRKEWTGSQWLSTTDGWDSSNDLISTTNARGYETDYSYDLNGNEVAVGAPSTNGFRPTTLYDYDSTNNVTALCDPNEVHQASKDWTAPFPAVDNLCSSLVKVGHAQATFTYPSYEPYGELSLTTTPSAYARTISYSPSQQGGTLDYGLPTAIVGQEIVQADGTTRTPKLQFWYGSRGWLGCFNNGSGTTVFKQDGLGRVVLTADGDDSSANVGSTCAKTSGISGWNTQTDSTYFPDGSLASVETPLQQGTAGAATTYTYDADGNKVWETVYFSPGVPVKRQYWYDAEDRLVEVDNGVAASAGWLTRYLYDISVGKGVSLTGTGTFDAHGNLFGTEVSHDGWTDTKGSAFDALDREVTSFRWEVNCSGLPCTTVASASKIYDATVATLGLMTSSTNEVGGTATKSYDPLGRETSVVYSGDGGVTPNETKTYDANGHILLTTSSTFGTMTDTYNSDGKLSKRIEPSGGGVTSPATLTYAYYGDDTKKSLSVASSSLTEAPLFSYSYRADGLRQTLVSNAAPATTYQWQETAGGRYTSQTVNGVAKSSTQSYNIYGEATAHTIASNLSYYPASGAQYDLQGNLTSVLLGGSGGVTQTMTYDALSELTTSTPSVQQSNFCRGFYCPTIRHSYILGTATTTSTSTVSMGVTSTESGSQTFDPASGAIVTSNNTTNASPPTPNPGCGGPQLDKRGFGYDAAGREEAGSWQWGYTSVIPNHSCYYYSGSGSMSQTFDSNNNVVTHTESDWVIESNNGIQVPVTWTLSYGPNGRLALAKNVYQNGTTDSATLHWDADNLLFVNDGLTGTTVYNEGALSLGDFDTAGYTSSTEGYALNYNYFPSPESDGAAYATIGFPELFVYTAPGSITDGVNTIQGVRQVDPITQQWKTPDKYEGHLDDPMSQRKYLWTNNNPISYSDPSGFCSNPGSSGIGVCADFFIMTWNAGGLAGDNRDFNGNLTRDSDSYRVKVNLDFADHSKSNIEAAHTHDVFVHRDLGKGHDEGSSITWDGNTATVTIANRCGPCVSWMPAIAAKITFTLNSDGSVSVQGWRSAYPSLEIYEYNNGGITPVYGAWQTGPAGGIWGLIIHVPLHI
jgi:YD repeat-containing protein